MAGSHGWRSSLVALAIACFTARAEAQPAEPEGGAIEQSLRMALARSVEEELRAGRGHLDTKVLRDFVAAARRSIEQPSSGGRDLDFALVRAGAVLALAAELPQDPACTARLDAVYEGLAKAVASRGTTFPESNGAVAPECEAVLAAAEAAAASEGSGRAARLAGVLGPYLVTSREDLEEPIALLLAEIALDPERSLVARALFEAMRASIVTERGRATIQPAAVLRQLADRFDVGEGGRPTLRSVLGWPSSEWVVDVSAVVPKLSSDTFRVGGDGAVGYRGKALGATVRGGASYFDFASGGLTTDMFHGFAGLDASWRFYAPSVAMRLDAHLDADFDYYDTTTIQRPTPGTRVRFGDYDSLLLRARARLGVSGSPSDRIGYEVTAGVGPQYETFDSTSLDERGLLFQSPDAVTITARATAAVRWRTVPSVLAIRLRFATDYFSITREDLRLVGTVVTITQEEKRQIEVSSRLFVDLDAARVAGFVPAMTAGLDVFDVSGDAGSASATVPVFGVGIFRP
jgi:hypothetical protein